MRSILDGFIPICERVSYMKKISKVIGIALITSCQIFTTAFASGDVCTVDKPSEPGKVKIEIETSPNNSVLVQILTKSTDISTLDSALDITSSIKYFRNITADKDGKAVALVELDASGEYKAYAKFNGNDKIYDNSKNEFYFVKETDYKSIIDRLNTELSADDLTDFKTILLDTNDSGVDNTKAIGFYTDLAINYGDAAELLYNSVKASSLDYDVKKNMALSNACIGIEALKENKTDNAFPLLKEYLNITADFGKFSSRHINTTDAEKKFSKILKSEVASATNLTQIETGVKTALLLTVVNYPENSGGNIKEVMTAYSSVLSASGLSTLSDNVRVYDLLKGKNLNTISELISEYSNALQTVNTQNSGIGSENSGNNSSLVSGGGSVSIPQGGNFSPNNGKINLKFEDLDGVSWAYSAISRLFEKNVISGYSVTQFKPSNKVKREEFVKMLVCAMGLDNEKANNQFADVAGDWSENYVAVAFAHNLVNGVSNGAFGKGMEIKRQDMSLMIYNALLASGYTPNGHSYNFSDEASDYARTAIAELSGMGIVNGVGDNIFNPFGISTRAEAAVIIDRAMKYFN